jgi:citrate lyase subunit beta / citryl-CoA lyase
MTTPGERSLPRLRRSCLAVPASNARMIEKAAELPADMVFLDLEDAVAPSAKDESTRREAARALRELAWSAPMRGVRVNAVSTRWCHRDVVAVVEEAGPAIHCLVVPKVESAGQVHFVDTLLSQLEDELELPTPIRLELQIESARGLVAIEDIASASARTETLVFGPGDFAASVGMPQQAIYASDERYPGDQWHYALMRILTTARAYGLQAIDGPYASIRDAEGLRASALRSRIIGFDGKWVIHPDQIAACNDIYLPSDEEYTRAETLLEAYDQASRQDRRGAITVEGEMIDEASRKLADQVVARGRAGGMARK